MSWQGYRSFFRLQMIKCKTRQIYEPLENKNEALVLWKTDKKVNVSFSSTCGHQTGLGWYEKKLALLEAPPAAKTGKTQKRTQKSPLERLVTHFNCDVLIWMELRVTKKCLKISQSIFVDHLKLLWSLRLRTTLTLRFFNDDWGCPKFSSRRQNKRYQYSTDPATYIQWTTTGTSQMRKSWTYRNSCCKLLFSIQVWLVWRCKSCDRKGIRESCCLTTIICPREPPNYNKRKTIEWRRKMPQTCSAGTTKWCLDSSNGGNYSISSYSIWIGLGNKTKTVAIEGIDHNESSSVANAG